LSNGATGRGDGSRSPRATALISSRRSVSVRCFISILQFNILFDDYERDGFLITSSLDGIKEVDQQLVGVLECIRPKFVCTPKPMPMVVLCLAPVP